MNKKIKVICPYCMEWQIINSYTNCNVCRMCKHPIEEPYFLNWKDIDDEIKKRWTLE